MARFYRVKNVPSVVRRFFEVKFPAVEGYTYNFYWYHGIHGKTYGCFVMKDGSLYSYADQRTEEQYAHA